MFTFEEFNNAVEKQKQLLNRIKESIVAVWKTLVSIWRDLNKE